MIRSLLILISGVIIGIIAIAYTPINYLIPATENHALDRLKDTEELSREYFLHEEPTARGNAQAFYILYSYRSWDSGSIPDSDYYRAQAIGYLRFCITQEQLGKTELSDRTCAIAKTNLNQWKPDMSFEEFRALVNNEDFMWYTLPNE